MNRIYKRALRPQLGTSDCACHPYCFARKSVNDRVGTGTGTGTRVSTLRRLRIVKYHLPLHVHLIVSILNFGHLVLSS